MGLVVDAQKFIARPSIIFWDFDGVIKDTIDLKGIIFYDLFKIYGEPLANRITAHHKENGGMSRREKFQIYLEWAGLSGSLEDKISQLCEEFFRLNVAMVVNADWVPGVETYLKKNINEQIFILISAMPDRDLTCILSNLKIENCFTRIYGSSTPKFKAIKNSLTELSLSSDRALMIGDSLVDYEASQLNNVEFFLRVHKYNQKLLALNNNLNYFINL